METEMSIKELFQQMAGAEVSMELMQGTVTQVGPLRITMENDEKHIITERITIVPRHLTDYETTATFELAQGSISAYTEGDGKHSHSPCAFGSGHSGDGTHTHHLVTFKLAGGKIVVHNALKVGDKVHVLSLCKGKLYYVLDRKEAEA